MATYKVKKGDTLSSIAKQNGLTVDEIAKANNITNVNKIYTGQDLNIGNSGNIAQAGDTNPASVSQKSDLQNSYDMYQNLLKGQPNSYQNQYASQINDVLSKINNRGKFSYDAISDPLYQQYKDQYVNLGKNAMMDTMGNAATLTGGYGNTYASTAGNQAYQGYLQGLNDVVPDLYNSALNQYNNEGTDLYNQLSGLQNAEAQDYSRYRDSVSDYYTQLGNAQSAYDMLYNNDLTEKKLKASETSGSGAGSGSSEASTETTISIDNLLNKNQQKSLQEAYDNGGMEGVQAYLDKFEFSDDEWSYLLDYLNKDLNYDVNSVINASGDTTGKSYPVMWDAVSNMLGGYDQIIKENNNSSPLRINTYEQAISAGIPKTAILTENDFSAARQYNKNLQKYSNYSDYLGSLAKAYIG